MRIRSTGKAIDDLISATYAAKPSIREQYVFKQVLHGLVRLAKAEQMLEIKMNVEKMTGSLAGVSSSRRHTKAILRKIQLGCNNRQQQLEFGAGEGNSVE